MTNGARDRPAPGVDRPREHPFARPAFSPDQDHGVGRRHLTALFQDRADLRVLAIERELGHLAADLLLQVGDLALQRPNSLESLQDRPDLRGRERLGQVIERPAPHRIDGAVDAGISRDDHHRQSRRELCEGLEQVEARFISQPQVDERHVERSTLDPFWRRHAGLTASSTEFFIDSRAIRRLFRILVSSSTIRMRIGEPASGRTRSRP